MTLKFADVNARFSGIVARYLADGWRINTGTMEGSQGEVAKVDLTDGSKIVRVLMTRDMDARLFQNVVRVMVGYADTKVDWPCDEVTHMIIWNGRLDIIEMHRFVEMREGVYMELSNDDIDDICSLRKKRVRQTFYFDSFRVSHDITSDEVKRIILPAVRRKIGFKTAKASDIEVVILNRKDYRHQYDVVVRGKMVTF